MPIVSLALANWWLSSTTRNAVLLGLAAGISLLAKFYAIPLVLFVFVLVLLLGCERANKRAVWLEDVRLTTRARG